MIHIVISCDGLHLTVLWQTGIPKRIFAKLYCSWKRVKREVKIISEIFHRYNARKLIEFGCGLGRHGYLMAKMGFNVLLTDVKDWRLGVAKLLPFVKLDILNNDIHVEGVFDGGYGINFLTIFDHENMVKALNNIGKIIGNGIFIADYNFTVYNEPKVVEVNVGKKTYRAVLEKEEVETMDGGVLYRYKVKVFDCKGRVVGIEESSYPVYKKEVVFKAIKEADFRILDIVWVRWDPTKYIYKLAEGESDSAFIVMSKASR